MFGTREARVVTDNAEPACRGRGTEATRASARSSVDRPLAEATGLDRLQDSLGGGITRKVQALSQGQYRLVTASLRSKVARKNDDELVDEIEDEDDDLDDEELDDEDLEGALDDEALDDDDVLDDDDDEDDDFSDADDEDDDDDEDDEDEDEEDEDGPSSLDQLLEKRTAARAGTDDADDDDDDLLSLVADDGPAAKEPRAPVIPLRDREEFVCRSCFLVKAKVQLADPERQLCRDCV